MTPDEVVKELEIHYQTNCMVGDIGVAIKSAITLLQDYQKLRERIDLEKIKNEITKAMIDQGVSPLSYYEGWNDGVASVLAQAIVTYLGGGE